MSKTLNALIWEPCEALGQSKESFVVNAQAKRKNAWLASQHAALRAWKSGLVADQAQYDAAKLRTSFFTMNKWFSTCIGFQPT